MGAATRYPGQQWLRRCAGPKQAAGACWGARPCLTRNLQTRALRVGRRGSITSLAAELGHGGCVDQHLQDQMIVFMSLAKGTSRFRSGPLTLHTETAMYMCGLLTGATFAVEKTGPGPAVVIECRGIGFTRA